MVQNSSLPPLKEGYITLKRTLYHRFFTHTSYLFAFLTLFELLRALYFFKISILFETSLLFIAGTIFYKWISTLKHHQEISMTIFWTLLYFLSILAHYYGDTGYFNHPQDSFHFGTINSIFESLIISRMPKLSHRIAFSSCNALTRLILIPPKDKSLLAVQFSSLLFGFFLDFDKETHDQNLFTTYFNHKQQLIQFKHLVSQDIPEGILIISQDLKQCLFMNNHFKALTGNSSLANVKAQLASFTLQEVLPNLPQNDLETSITEPSIHQETLWSFLEQHCKQPQHKKTSCHISYQGQETQQEYRFEAKIVHIIWDEQPSLAIIFHDITQHHTILGLQIADSHKDKILATVSHELRTPLNSIMGMIQIMLKEVKDQSLVQYLDICKSSGLLLSGLVNSIVDLNLIRARKFKVNPEKIELRKFIRETLHLFEFQCSQKGIYLKSKLSSLLPIYIVTDKDRLSQIFINLLSNSLKFTNTGGITISAQVASNKDYIEFTVADTGFGIKSHDKEKLFTKEFSRINPQGVGLGLAVSDSLARLLGHQGEGLVVASEENKGSKLSFIIKKSLGGISRGSIEGIIPASPEYFPSPPIPSIKEVGDVNNRMQNYCSKLKRANTLQLLSATASRNILSDSESPSPRKGLLTSQLSSPLKSAQGTSGQYTFSLSLQKETPCVLIVDDNPLNIMVAEHLVSSHKFKVKTALSGHIALDIAMNHNYLFEPIRLILMDCQMPVMDGYETTRSLKDQMRLQNIPEIPIIALTANDSEADKEACKRAGMCEHLTKPLKDQELVRILKKYCGYTPV